jgi:hypothetical protein
VGSVNVVPSRASVEDAASGVASKTPGGFGGPYGSVGGRSGRAGSRGASDLGNIDHFTFNRDQLDGMKKTCQKHCFSTLNHNFAYCYNGARVIRWMWEKRKALIPRLRPLLDCPLSLSSKLSLGF